MLLTWKCVHLNGTHESPMGVRLLHEISTPIWSPWGLYSFLPEGYGIHEIKSRSPGKAFHGCGHAVGKKA